MYKIAEIATQLANCILLHAYLPRAAASSCASTGKNFIKLILRAGIIAFLIIN